MDEALRFSQSHGVRAGCQALDLPPSSLYREKLRRERPAMDPRPRPASPRALSPPEKELSWRSCTASGLSTKLPPQCGRSYWMKGDTCARSEPCIAFCPNVWKSRSVAASAAIPNTPSQNSWPPAPTNVGHGTSPSSRVPKVILPLVVLDIFSRYVVGWMVARRTHAWPRL